MRVTNKTTWGQARRQGIKLKEFNRRRKISMSLKQYHKSAYTTKKTIEDRKRIVKKRQKKVDKIPLKRLRKQVVLNCRPNFNDYNDSIGGIGALSIRAITINPEYNERALLMAVEEIKPEIELKLGVNLRDFQKRYLGLEDTEIPKSEDARLNDYKIHIEVWINNPNTPHGKILNFTKS